MSEKKQSFVLKALKNVAKGTWFGVSALFFPLAISWNRKRYLTIHGYRTLAKTAIFLTGMALPSLTARLFPTAETFLKSKDVAPEWVSVLAPGMEGKIRVRTDNWMGKTHALFDQGIFENLLGETSLNKDNVVAYATTDYFETVKLIYMKDQKLSPEKKEGKPPEKKENAPEKKEEIKIDVPEKFHLPKIYFFTPKEMERIHLSEEESYLEVIFHEIRHHAPENGALEETIEREADAEFMAAKVLGDLKGESALLGNFIDQLARVQFSETHDVALILDAKFNGYAIPKAQEIIQANKDAKPTIYRIRDQRVMENLKLCEKWPEKHKEICLTEMHMDTLSALAQRRVQLFRGSTHDKPIHYKQKVMRK